MKTSPRKTFQKFIAATSAAVLCLSLLGVAGCSTSASSESADGTSEGSSSAAASVSAASGGLLSGTYYATVTVAGFDPFDIELDADSAPITVTNFVNLVESGYYNGLSFYRIQDDFCLQGGTYGNSISGSDPSLEPITGEFSSNGVDNPLADNFQRGTVAMARTTDPDSATSTFFITLGNSAASSLNGSYAAFGTIDETGMAIIDSIIAKYDAYADQQNMGVISEEANQPIISSITIEP